MEITLQISSLIIISLGIIGMFLSLSMGVFILYQKKLKDKATLFLFALMLTISLTVLNETLATSGMASRFKNLYFLPLNFSLSISPLFYLFVKRKMNRFETPRDLIHLILPFIQFIVFVLVGFRSVAFKTKLWNNENFKRFLQAETILFILGLLIYSFLSYVLVAKSDQDQTFWKIDLRTWLMQMVKVFILLVALELGLFIGEEIFASRFSQIFYVFRSLIFLLIIAWLVYSTFKLLYPISIYRSTPKINEGDPSDNLIIATRLESLINKEQIHLNPDLSLEILAKY